MLRELVVAGRFLTRVPLPGRDVEARELAPATAYFPVVGALVGAATSAFIWLLEAPLGLDAAIAGGLAFGALLTGGFHEDGLADTCDGLGGGVTRERALEIMRDPRVGSYGVIALVLLYLARFTLLGSLGLARLVLVYPIAACLGRASSVVLMAWLPSARASGLGGETARDVGRFTVVLGIGLALGITIAFAGGEAPLLVVPAAVVTLVAGVYFRHRLGGVTGDCLGAANTIAELATLASAVALARLPAYPEVLPWR